MTPYLRRDTPSKFSEIPETTAFEAGFLTTVNSGWRSSRPVVDTEKCAGCGRCYLYCPDGVISIQNGRAVIDYNFCKGCGICTRICRLKAIGTEAEK